MSGHCRFPETPQPTRSHERCQKMGHGNTANPDKEFSPCPCHCHLGTDLYECGNCGEPLREAPHWPNEDEPGEMVYVHVDSDGNALAEECAHLRKTEPEPEPEVDYSDVFEDEDEDEDADEDDGLDDVDLGAYDDIWDELEDEDF
jgi:hypothetical protein